MANDGHDNLIPLNKLPKEKQREIQRMGGKARVKQRRDNRTFRETFAQLLAMPDKGKDGEPLISPITGKPMSIRENIVIQALLGARKGNLKALNTILKVLGELVEKVESDMTVRTDKYDHMSDEELRAEAKRLLDSMSNP